MTREELKEVLASKANKLGLQAMEVIRAGESLESLKALIDAGAALVIYERDPRHPRSQYLTRYLITATYETVDDPVTPKITGAGGVEIMTYTISLETGPKAFSDKIGVRLAMFKYLVGLNASGGSNGMRGEFFQSILNNAFYRDTNESKFAFAKALVEARPEILTRYVANNYQWHDTVRSYETLLALGADPKTPGAIANVLKYAFCSGPGNEPCMPIDAEIARRLAAAGAALTMEEYQRLHNAWAQERHCTANDLAFLETLNPVDVPDPAVV